jgi:TRAP-type C4-dicarboxylate transport system substrate-binding protein
MKQTSFAAGRIRKAVGSTLAAFACVLMPLSASAEQVTLRAVSSFAEGTFFARNFERFVEKVNKEGKGLVQINYIGGPKAIPPFEVANALRGGVVDMANTTGVYYTNIIPEAMAFSFTELPVAELRKNGGFEYMNKLHEAKGLTYLARVSDGLRYHLYTNKKFENNSLKGHKVRIAPVFREFFQTLGGTVVQTAPGEVYTALERGVVDGYGWPITGIFDLGWHEKTKFRVDPGFYNVEVGIIMNLNSWKKLDAKQREFMEKQLAWAESLTADHSRDTELETKRQKDAGITPITLSAAESKQFLDTAREAAWKGIVTASPVHGPKLRQLYTKQQ